MAKKSFNLGLDNTNLTKPQVEKTEENIVTPSIVDSQSNTVDLLINTTVSYRRTRPKKDYKVISFSIPAGIANAVRDIAHYTNRKINAVVVEALEVYLDSKGLMSIISSGKDIRQDEYTSVCYSLPPAIIEQLKETAYKYNKPKNYCVAEALSNYIAKPEYANYKRS